MNEKIIEEAMSKYKPSTVEWIQLQAKKITASDILKVDIFLGIMIMYLFASQLIYQYGYIPKLLLAILTLILVYLIYFCLPSMMKADFFSDMKTNFWFRQKVLRELGVGMHPRQNYNWDTHQFDVDVENTIPERIAEEGAETFQT